MQGETWTVTGRMWKGVCPPAKVGLLTIAETDDLRCPEWAEEDGWQALCAGTFQVRRNARGEYVARAVSTAWGRPPRGWRRVSM